MKYKILQLKDLHDCDYSFEGWDWAKDRFNINDYKVVYEGEIEGNSNYACLEKLFEIFNIRHPEDFRGHSLSVSDIVILDDGYWYCDSWGWTDITDEVK